jgi:hypothetical protein
MALQDLTPQLRTRLRRVEWLVVLFLTGTALLMLAGLGWFIKTTGDQRGWWITQVPYYTYMRDGGAIKVGTPVKMTGFTIGEVVSVDTLDDGGEWDFYRTNRYHVFVRFLVRHPYEGYIFTDSRVKLTGIPIDLAGGASLEVTRSMGLGIPTTTNLPADKVGLLHEKFAYTSDSPKRTNDFLSYREAVKRDKGYYLVADEGGDLIAELTLLLPKIREAFSKPGGLGDLLIPVALAARLDRPGGLGEIVLPPDLHAALTKTLTNVDAQIGDVGSLVSNLNATVPPLLTNLTVVIPPLASNLDRTLPPVLTNLNTQLTALGPLLTNLDRSLPPTLSNLTLTLASAQSNTLPAVDGLLTNTTDFIEGLKRHWLFRSAFKEKRTPRK